LFGSGKHENLGLWPENVPIAFAEVKSWQKTGFYFNSLFTALQQNAVLGLFTDNILERRKYKQKRHVGSELLYLGSFPFVCGCFSSSNASFCYLFLYICYLEVPQFLGSIELKSRT